MIDQLAKLSELAPDVCKQDMITAHYQIGDYEFWQHLTYGFMAAHVPGPGNSLNYSVTGRPALAWLRDAMEGEIERRGWGYRVEMWDLSGKYAALVWHLNYTNGLTFGNSAVECLLAAFLAAVEGEGR